MKKILIIEDDQLVANIYRNKFSVEGFQVEVALDGAAGFDLVNSFHPDAIILDLMLPKVTGVDVLKKIRAQPSLQQLPVIVFSNTYLSNMVQEAWKAGATKCLSKANCPPKQVIEVLRTLFASQAPPPAAVESAPSTSADSDAAVQAELQQSLLESLPGTLGALRVSLQALAKGADEATRVKHLQDLYRRIHALTGNAGVAGMVQIAHVTDALEALLKELYEKPKNINASTLRTVASATDFLGVLFDRAKVSSPPETQPQLKASVLVVDDEAISRRAVIYALEKAKLSSVMVESPEMALKKLAETSYDLIFLDVDMPGMNGFELCSKLRTFQRNKTTPVVFVTTLTDFESRANSTMSGGNDLIAKPFLFMELAVKALVYIMRARLGPAK
jgi:DNA-binding response OmpR family regulator